MFCKRCGEQVDTSSRFCPRCGEDLTSLTGTGRGGATAPLAAQPAAENEDEIVRDALKEEYEIEKELGRGGMAVVYKARDKQLEREVAIKILPFSLSFDAEFVERFQREARTAGKLEHPNIIPIYRVGRAGRVIYFVMKFIRGKSLSGVMESRGALPVPEIKRFLIECARALGYAHKHGIVHRDIKPDNIMFDELGQAIVTDFGIAKAQSGARLTGTGMSIGTPHYMSPEQARAQNLDGRSDVYSLGVVGYQCLTGHVPFDGEDSFSIGYKHIMEELPVPALETAEQRELFAVIQKMMAKKADDRFQNAEELIAALETGSPLSMADMSTMPTRAIEPMKPPPKPAAPPVAAAATTPLPRASASMGKPKEAEAEPAAPAPAPKPAARKVPPPRRPEERKSNAGLVAAALVVLAAAGGGGYWVFLRPKPAPTTQVAQQPSAPAVTPATTPDSGAARPDSTKAAADTAKAPPPASSPAPTPTPPAPTRTPTGTTRTPTAPTRTPTTTAAPVAARTGTIVLGGTVPAGATVTVNGQRHTGTRIEVPSGQARLEIAAQGYQTFSRRVDVPAGGVRNVKVEMAAAAAAAPTTATPAPTTATPAPTPPSAATAAAALCATPQGSTRNTGRACWDTRPIARTAPVLPAPADCPASTRSVSLLVNVSAQGEVVGNPTVQTRSGCASFDAAAQAQILDITFQPAVKNGQPVAAWVVIQFRKQ
jgi:serine/threonine-protein kinase